MNKGEPYRPYSIDMILKERYPCFGKYSKLKKECKNCEDRHDCREVGENK